jgi:iron(III) transport system ATP-binding protein
MKNDQKVIVSARPEELLLSTGSEPGMNAAVDDCVFLGLNTHYFVHFDDGEEAEIIQESTIDNTIAPGTRIKLTLNTRKVNIFTQDGSENLLKGVCNDCSNA